MESISVKPQKKKKMLSYYLSITLNPNNPKSSKEWCTGSEYKIHLSTAYEKYMLKIDWKFKYQKIPGKGIGKTSWCPKYKFFNREIQRREMIGASIQQEMTTVDKCYVK